MFDFNVNLNVSYHCKILFTNESITNETKIQNNVIRFGNACIKHEANLSWIDVREPEIGQTAIPAGLIA